MKNFWKDLPKPFFALAPMEAVTDLVFRQVIEQASPPDVFFTEFANATGWAHAGDKAIAGRLAKLPSKKPLVAQIWGGEPGDLELFAEHCAKLSFDGIDINMGCPAKSAIKSGGAGLIRQPDLAIKSIHSAKQAGLPVSVKTRLGYSRIDEWHDWLELLLAQDIANLTVHLRTKKEMSKVPAHFELIDDIVQLRNSIAPQTKLTINGDIRDRMHGMELYEKHGVDGIMIGRGVLLNPFAFAKGESRSMNNESGNDSHASCSMIHDSEHKQALFDLLALHLDLFDKYQPVTNRPFETLKRFFKIYVRDFDGASDLRAKMMETKSTKEVRQLVRDASHEA